MSFLGKFFFLLIFKSNFQEIYVMSPFLFPDIDTWSASKTGLIMNKITKIFGIFNGTSNYILSSMDKEIVTLPLSELMINDPALASCNCSSVGLWAS